MEGKSLLEAEVLDWQVLWLRVDDTDEDDHHPGLGLDLDHATGLCAIAVLVEKPD